MPHQLIHFWVAQFNTEEQKKHFFEEHYNQDHNSPISTFAKSQGETWIDHDFLETGFQNEGSLRDRIINYSYSEHWIDELIERIEKQDLSEVNTLVMCLNDGDYAQIEEPQSFRGDGYWGEYLGEIAFDYKHPDWFQAILDGKG